MAGSTKTIQDILDGMSDEQRDIQAIVVGAAVQGADLSSNEEIVAKYNALPQINKYIIDFIVGNADVKGGDLNHTGLDQLDNFLAHYGVKGMKWGIRKERDSGGQRLSKSAANTPLARRAARDKVRGGKGTLKDAHIASLKSTGHRVTNGFLGDKTFWRRMAVTAGVTALGIVLGNSALPALIPDSVLTSIGSDFIGMSPSQADSILNVDVTKLGEDLVGIAGFTTAGVAGAVAGGTHAVGNVARAVRGNARINKSYAELGKEVVRRQNSGSKRVAKTLRSSGSLRKRDVVKHDAVTSLIGRYAELSLDQLREG